MSNTYLIILGDIGNKHYKSMLENMEHIGDVKKILDSVFIMTTTESIGYEEIRNEVSGPNHGYCIVISIKNLIAAWNLTPANSEYLQSFFANTNGNEQR